MGLDPSKGLANAMFGQVPWPPVVSFQRTISFVFPYLYHRKAQRLSFLKAWKTANYSICAF